MRLIDAEELMRDIDEIYDTDKHKWSEDAEDILKEISEARTVDVEPIRHGHWIKVETPHTSPYELNIYKCSECDAHLFAVVDGYRYCPNCGALMDEVEE